MKKLNLQNIEAISELKSIPQEELMELIKESQKGNLEAYDLIVEGNLKLVLSVVKKFNNWEENLDDLFQVGVKGLLKAIDDFDFSYGVKFSTYAVPMIIGEIRRYLRSKVKISRPLKNIAYKAIYYKKRYLKQNHKEPSVEEIAEKLGVEIKDVIMALEAIQEYMLLVDNGDEISLTNQLGDSNNNIKEGLSKLDEHLRKIIEERYFNGKTQKEIALELGISQSQVSKLEKKALEIIFDEN